MKTETERYEASHNKKPKGWGEWAFELTGIDGQGAYLTETWTARGTLSKARAQAVKDFKSSSGRIKEVVSVVVLP